MTVSSFNSRLGGPKKFNIMHFLIFDNSSNRNRGSAFKHNLLGKPVGHFEKYGNEHEFVVMKNRTGDSLTVGSISGFRLV